MILSTGWMITYHALHAIFQVLSSWYVGLPSLKLTYPLKIDPWKRRFLLETIVFRGYVSFRECISNSARIWKQMTEPKSFRCALGQVVPVKTSVTPNVAKNSSPNKINKFVWEYISVDFASIVLNGRVEYIDLKWSKSQFLMLFLTIFVQKTVRILKHVAQFHSPPPAVCCSHLMLRCPEVFEQSTNLWWTWGLDKTDIYVYTNFVLVPL